MNLISIPLVDKLNTFCNKFIHFEDFEEIEESRIRPLILSINIVNIIFDKFSDNLADRIKDLIYFLSFFKDCENMDFRSKMGKTWVYILKSKRDIIFEYYEDLFSFFFDNYRVEHYEMNLSASNFFLFLLEEYGNYFEIYKEQKANNANDKTLNNNNSSPSNQSENKIHSCIIHSEKISKEKLDLIINLGSSFENYLKV